MDRKLTVLAVDDEQVVLNSIYKHLRKENFVLKTVLTASQALEVLGRDRIDIVLTDLMMPEMNRLELLARITENSPETLVIMITGYATISTALQAKHSGAFDYITKPFTRVELQSVVYRAVNHVTSAEAAKDNTDTISRQEGTDRFKVIGNDTWILREKEGSVLLVLRDHSSSHWVGFNLSICQQWEMNCAMEVRRFSFLPLI